MKPKRPSDYPWPVTAHHASFIEDFTNAMDSRPITPTTASDSAMTTPPTATPRTNDGLLAVALACEHCTESVHLYGTDMKKHGADIRRVLAELAAERERVRVLEEALAFITKHGGMTIETECGEIQCSGFWCAEQARAAMKSPTP